MIRRISTKLVLAVLAAVVLPLVVFAFYLNEQMTERLTRHVVQQALMGLAKDLATQVDSFVLERHRDLELWAGQPLTLGAVAEARGAGRGGEGWGPDAVRALGPEGTEGTVSAGLGERARLTRELDRYLELKAVYDLLLLVDANGRLITCTTRDPEGVPLGAPFLTRLFGTDFGPERWFVEGSSGARVVTVDHHVSPYALPRAADPTEPARGFHLGFAAPVRARDAARAEPTAVLYGLVNWSSVQDLAGTPVVRDAFRGLVDEEPSPYAWIWAADADTILGHPNRELYYQSITRDLDLPQMTRAVMESEAGWGLYPEYEFAGERKNAAFRRCAPPEEGGFGWVVGVGIDNDDIYATAGELRTLLIGGTAAVLAVVVVLLLVIARRTTGPILELQNYTRRVAEGDLDAQVAIGTRDELGALAGDFNHMTRKLKEQQERIVKAEKDAAWREMARQIAHDIKNPLTPIRLSLDLLERARRDEAADFDRILERTTGLIRRQVTNLHEIAGDFHEFTGGRRPRIEALSLTRLLDEVLHLHDAWAVEQGVEIRRDGAHLAVLADEGKLRRVLVNLVSNALQSMGEGGVLSVLTEHRDGRVCVAIRDTGSGIPEEAREHLFEPYFTTKSEGTGLGLAISKQVMEQMEGRIEVEPAPDGVGTLARVWLPEAPDSSAASGNGGLTPR